MSNDNVILLKKPESIINDHITDILRQGARKMLAQALEAEIDHFISQYDELNTDFRNKYNRHLNITFFDLVI